MNATLPVKNVCPEVPPRATLVWLSSLPSCDMSRFRKLLHAGGSPVFILDEQSRKPAPIWRLLARDGSGRLWQVTTGRDLQARRLTSVQQVYQIARNAGLASIHLPVDLGDCDP